PTALYQSTASLTNWVVGLLLLTAFTTLLVGGIDLFYEASVATASDSTLATLGVTMILFGVGALLSYLVCGIVFLVWVHRTTSNGHALGGNGLTSPGWAVVFWFIPILNLFRPYQSLRDVYRVSLGRNSPGSLETVAVPGFFGAWWTFWVVSSILGRIESRLPRLEADTSVVMVVSILSTLSTLAAAYFCIQVVRNCSQIQDEHYQASMGQAEGASPYSPQAQI
ncbi:MAG: DUF4328 domain-containing protein, partial [Planctomycetota bacterium]